MVKRWDICDIIEDETGDKERDEAISLILQYGQTDGAHHKNWVLDQVLRVLTGSKYDAVIKEYKGYEYEWDEGIAP